MNSILPLLFQQPSQGYLKPAELTLLGRYVGSLPERLKLYRQLRDQEPQIIQTLVDRLPPTLTPSPQSSSSETQLEQSVKQLILVLRYAAMGMLIDDPEFARRRLQDWLPALIAAHQTEALDRALQQLLQQLLSRLLTESQLALLKPHIEAVKPLLVPTAGEAVAHPQAS
jgi:hypothetical protein